MTGIKVLRKVINSTYLTYMEGVDNLLLPYSKVKCVVSVVVLYRMDYVIMLQAQLLVGNDLCVMATPCVDMDTWRIRKDIGFHQVKPSCFRHCISNKHKVTAAGHSIVIPSPVLQLDVVICNISTLHNYTDNCWRSNWMERLWPVCNGCSTYEYICNKRLWVGD